jgi:hypothetical protein
MSEDIDVSIPHGIQQDIKIELMEMIHNCEDPFQIIGHIAEYLERTSAEGGYAQIVKDNIRSIYGIGLGEPKLLENELHDIIERGKKLKQAYESDIESEEVKKRIEFAIIHHRKRAEQLQLMIRSEKADRIEQEKKNH